MVRLVRLLRWTITPIGPKTWDWAVWATGGVTLLATAVYLLIPQAGELVVFFTMMFLTSGPMSTFLPAASEPILMAFGRLYPPLVLAVVGTAAIIGIECLNYRLFGAVLHSRALEAVRVTKATRTVLGWYRVWPFGTVVVCALTPAPFWLARCCAALERYPAPRFLLATAAGRFPRLWLIALAGTVMPFAPSQIFAGGMVVVVLAMAVGLLRRQWVRAVPAPVLVDGG